MHPYVRMLLLVMSVPCFVQASWFDDVRVFFGGDKPAVAKKSASAKKTVAAKKNKEAIAKKTSTADKKELPHVQLDMQPALDACEQGDVRHLTEIIASNKGMVRATDQQGWTLLHWACFLNRCECVAVLLKEGAEIGAQSKLGWTPLHVACSSTEVDAWQSVGLLISFAMRVADTAKASSDLKQLPKKLLNAKTGKKETPLHIACMHGSTECVRFLLAQQDVLLDQRDELDATPLHYACFRQETDSAELLISKITDARVLNIQDRDGRTPLHVVCKVGHCELIPLLMDKNADPLIADKERLTPLHVACWYRNDECIRQLLQNNKVKTNINITANDKQTPLHIACWSGCLGCVKELRHGGAAIDVQNADDQTPLHLACFNGHLDCVTYLLDLRAGINAKSKSGATPLHEAVRGGSISCLEALLKRHADVGMHDKNGRTPLHDAARKGDLKCVQELIGYITVNNKQALTNVQDAKGNTPLHDAIFGGLDCVKLLVGAGAVQLKNKNGDTPLDVVHNQATYRIWGFIPIGRAEGFQDLIDYLERQYERQKKMEKQKKR